MQFEPVVLFNLFGHPVYAFGVCLALAAALCSLFLSRRGHRLSLRPGTTGVFVFYALILGVLFARLLYCALCWQDIAYDWDGTFYGYVILFDFSDGGYTLYGAFIGVFLAAWITARRTSQPLLTVLDWAAPACALMIALGRSVEILGGIGFGDEVLSEALSFFPFAVYNDWLGAYNYAVFMGEAAAALLILFLLLRLERKNRQPGDLMLLFLILFGAAQIVLERFRRDDVLAYGFILFAQVVSAVFLALGATVSVIRAFRSRRQQLPALFDGLLTVTAIGCAGLTEYLFDKNLFGVFVIDNTSLHLVRAMLLAVTAYRLSRRLLRLAESPETATAPAAASRAAHTVKKPRKPQLGSRG